jgi:hypothetical protein
MLIPECRLLGCFAECLLFLLVSSSPISVTTMMEGQNSFETSVLTGATRRNIPEDTILHSHRCEKLKSYIVYRLLHVNNVILLKYLSFVSCYDIVLPGSVSLFFRDKSVALD